MTDREKALEALKWMTRRLDEMIGSVPELSETINECDKTIRAALAQPEVVWKAAQNWLTCRSREKISWEELANAEYVLAQAVKAEWFLNTKDAAEKILNSEGA